MHCHPFAAAFDGIKDQKTSLFYVFCFFFSAADEALACETPADEAPVCTALPDEEQADDLRAESWTVPEDR